VPVYITNPEMLRSSTWSYSSSAIKKGLKSDGLTDESAVLSGVRHTIIDLELTSFISDKEHGTAHVYNEKEYYFDSEAIQSLDRRISELYLASVNVRLRLFVQPGDGKYSPLHSDRYCSINMSLRESCEQFAAILDFLALRYSDSDRTHGRVVGYILARTDDTSKLRAPSYYDTAEAALDYAAALRIMYNTVSVHGDAKVYMWLDGGWETGDGMTMNNRALLESLSAVTRQGGDFCWGIALDPYPNISGPYCSWLDNDLSTEFDAVTITSRNIDMLCRFLNRDYMLCGDGDVRSVILYDDNVPKSLAPMEEMISAAEFVLTYYKLNTRECAAVECFIIGGLPSYEEIFRDIDTDRTRATSEFALNVIGITDWRELFDGYDETLIVRRSVTNAGFSDNALRPDSDYVLFDGSEGELPLTRFNASSGLSALRYVQDTSSDSGYGTKLIDGAAMMAKLDGSGSAVIGAQTSYPLDLSATGWLSFRAQVSTLPQDVSSAAFTVLLYSGDSSLKASGTVKEGGWNDILIDISPFTSTGRRIDRIRFIIGPEGSEYDIGEAILYISPISVRSDTLSASELTDLFRAQYDSHFMKPAREYDMKIIIGLCVVGGIAVLLFVVRRFAPGKGKGDDEDFTDMEMWKQN